MDPEGGPDRRVGSGAAADLLARCHGSGHPVGVAPGEAVSDEDFKAQLETLNEELETLNAQARDLERTIAGNVAKILEV